jgi:hypothetical protein
MSSEIKSKQHDVLWMSVESYSLFNKSKGYHLFQYIKKSNSKLKTLTDLTFELVFP